VVRAAATTRCSTSERKEAITVQNLLDMTSGIAWTEPLDDKPFQRSKWSAAPIGSSSFSIDRCLVAPGEVFN
jgi:hypothetical protein